MPDDRRMRSLKRRQRSLVTSFALIVTFVDGYDDERDSCEVPVRLENLVKLWNEFNTVQTELENLDETGIDQHIKDRTDFESSYYKAKGFLLSVNKAPASPAPAANQSAAQLPVTTSSHVRLPDIKLPVFAGNLDGWLNFHDLFVSLVHSSHELSNIQKFYYLRSSLSGEALKLIQTITLSANNYQVAWNLLVTHYQNSARLKQSYVDTLFEFQSLKRESAADLHSLVEKFEANVKILKQLGEQTEYWDVLLIRMLSIRLDPTTRRDWEEFSSTKDAISFQDLTSFIQRRVTVLQTMQKSSDTPPAPVKKPVQRPIASHGASQSSGRRCLVCSDSHPLYQCAVFGKMGIEDKEKEIRRHQLCRNCLRKGHQARDCNSSSTCRKCRGRHHTQLCAGESSVVAHSKTNDFVQPKVATVQLAEEQSKASVSATIPSYASSNRGRQNVLLATAIVVLVDDIGTEHVARALLDSGSECCFITESLSQRVKAQRRRIHLPIAGIGTSTTHARQKLQTTIRSRICDYSTTVEFLVLPKVTINLPSAPVDVSSWQIPPGIQLADPSFNSSSSIDLVIGAEVFFDLFKVSGRIQLGDALPTLVNSVFGWVVSGKTLNEHSNASARPVIANVATVSDVHDLMEKFWTIEEDSNSTCYSVEEAACEEHFRRTVTRSPEGRYIVRLPLKEGVLNQLSDNRRVALRRFHLVENRLSRNSDQGDQYRDFMAEYKTLGHMEQVFDHETPPTPCYHLPHHAVVREDSTTTKLRVVFDATCKSSKGPSLNDALMVGPIVQEDLRSIIIRSRTHPIMLIADIKQMFRQILVDDQDTPLQRIVWRSSPEAPMDTYELKTVTYGTASAPYLATRVLKQLSEDEKDNYPKAAAVLRKDFYVDDLFSGGSSIEETIELRKQLESLLSSGGFELRKWASNKEEVLEGVDPSNRALTSSVDLHPDQSIKTLGLHWEPASDHIKYNIKLPSDSDNSPLTKRSALSQIASLFDPLGLVGPVITSAKIFMQSLWSLKTDDGQVWGWDQQLPDTISEHWHNYRTQLPLLNNLRIERCVICPNPSNIQLHFFSDSSERAYGACCYVRSTSSSGTIKTALLTAKSKIAPLKQQSIPRLELCAALLAAELYEKVQASLQLEAEAFFWVDSTTVISWLHCSPSTWTTFVANRVSKIQLATQRCNWNHVAGQQNPADYLSRGMPADQLLQADLWWKGPEWLQLEQTRWPTQQAASIVEVDSLPEARKTPVAVVSASVEPVEPSFIDQLVAKSSSYDRMIRAIAYCRRVVKPSLRAKTTILTAEEIGEAETVLIRLVQQQEFATEWKQLEQSSSVSSKSRLRWFHPFLSPDRLIRIGGRISQAQQPYEAKHQILLPSTHQFSALLLRSLHIKNLHAATQLLLTVLRLRYWITGARNLAKKTIHNCISCIKARPKLVQQFMAELPASRVTASRPFATTGIDYWGPILLKPPTRRAAPPKAYVAVFVCFTTKAVHIELVVDLTTAKFLQALRRFVSRRGLCADIHSDNGRNFLGAANELRQLVRSDQLQHASAQECASSGVRWHFNPPKASHFGGLWEAAISSAQKHFVRVLGAQTLPFDEMQTLLCQIESCLNSRPIVPLSDDPTDLEPLTPGHFLIGTSLKSVPDSDLTSIPFNRLKSWQQTQKMFQQIWQRWKSEYLCTLQARSKWCNPPVTINKDQLVLLKDDNTPPLRWPTARVHELHPGADGITRVVTLQTTNGFYTRPVSKLCLLPIAPPEEKSSNTNNDATSSSENSTAARITTIPSRGAPKNKYKAL